MATDIASIWNYQLKECNSVRPYDFLAFLLNQQFLPRLKMLCRGNGPVSLKGSELSFQIAFSLPLASLIMILWIIDNKEEPK